VESAELPFGSALEVFRVTISGAKWVFEIKSYPGNWYFVPQHDGYLAVGIRRKING
jgi:hypothetical protein